MTFTARSFFCIRLWTGQICPFFEAWYLQWLHFHRWRVPDRKQWSAWKWWPLKADPTGCAFPSTTLQLVHSGIVISLSENAWFYSNCSCFVEWHIELWWIGRGPDCPAHCSHTNNFTFTAYLASPPCPFHLFSLERCPACTFWIKFYSRFKTRLKCHQFESLWWSSLDRVSHSFLGHPPALCTHF